MRSVEWEGWLRGGEDKDGTHSGELILEEFFRSSCILKYLLHGSDAVKNQLFLPFRRLKFLWGQRPRSIRVREAKRH